MKAALPFTIALLFAVTFLAEAADDGGWGDDDDDDDDDPMHGAYFLEWRPCNRECGTGNQTRDKMCPDDNPNIDAPWKCGTFQAYCNMMPCDDPFEGIPWSDCDEECGGGHRSRENSDGDRQEIRCNTHSCVPNNEDCVGNVVFALDSSGSINETNWMIILQFVIDVMQGLKIAPNKTHVSVVVFSTEVETAFLLDEFFTMPELEPAVWSRPYMAGATNLADALKQIREIHRNDARPLMNGASIGCIITDGKGNVDAVRTSPEAVRTKEHVDMFAVAIGDEVIMSEIIGMASHEDQIYLAEDFEAVQSFTDAIAGKICSQLKPETIECSMCDLLSACSITCGEVGQQMGKYDCWKVNGHTREKVPGSDDINVPCNIPCNIPCPTTTTEATTTTPDATWEPDCSRCDYTHGQIWLEDPFNCHMYYVCEPIGNENYKAHWTTCGELYWNQEIHTCVLGLPADHECIVGTVSEYIQPSTEAVPCPYEPYPDDASKFWIIGLSNSIQNCTEGQRFVNTGDLCGCVGAPVVPACSDDMVLHFDYETNYNDVTCHKAIATQYGTGVSRTFDAVRGGDVACFTGETYFEVPFLRTWFAGNDVDKFTVSVWFKQEGELGDSRQSIVANGDCVDSYGFSIQVEDTNVVDDITTVGGTTAKVDGGTFAEGVWHHAVWVYDGAHLTTYLDDVVVTKTAITGNLQNNDVPMSIANCCGGHYFIGCLDEIRVYDRVLSSAAIALLP